MSSLAKLQVNLKWTDTTLYFDMDYGYPVEYLCTLIIF